MYFVWLFFFIVLLNESKFFKKFFFKKTSLELFFEKRVHTSTLKRTIIIYDFLNYNNSTFFFIFKNFFKNVFFIYQKKNTDFVDFLKNKVLNVLLKHKIKISYKLTNQQFITYTKNIFKLKLNLKKKLNLRFVKFENFFFEKYTKNNLIFFLRKNKMFNKSRYSRNRQIYRTGVYWCLWVNILFVYGLYYYFYRFSFNFGYLWFFLFIFICSFFFSRFVQYRFYNLKNIIKEIIFFKNWFFIFVNSFIKFINKKI